jgi:hypothetical protein
MLTKVLFASVFVIKNFHDFFDRVDHSRSRPRGSYPSCVTVYPRGSRSRVFQLGLTLVKNLYHLLNCVPIPRCCSDAKKLLDLAEVADRFHLATIEAEDESVLNRNDLRQPVVS